MCAIAGIVGAGPGDNARMVGQMLDSMKYRGPDHTEVQKLGDHVFFGHNRLSIIDLNAKANQPFKGNEGRYTIIFNGEIYNYVELRAELANDFSFETNSDTEVLLSAYQKWGKNCLDKLIGMFSFAIWDSLEETFFAARDRFGVKPFYYCELNGALLFASEIKALWVAGLPRIRNEKVWSSFLVYGSYGMPDESFWSRIFQLPAGHFLTIKGGAREVKRWYLFERNIDALMPEMAAAKENEIAEQFPRLLADSIRFRFRSDVRVGFNVSGGLDSSLLLSLIHRAYPGNLGIEAFSFYTGDINYDELPWVKALMETTSYPLHAVQLLPEDVPIMAEEMARVQDEPYGGIPTLAYSTLFREARRLGTIVLLDGQGIDEAWAGYDYYQTGSNSVVQGITGSPLRPNVLSKEFRRLAEIPSYPEPFGDRLLNLQYRDLFYTKIPRALRFNDRASMMHSTELREPFLDHRLVEMAFALPRRFKLEGGIGKFLLRKMTKRLLPDSISLAPKRPVQTPQREWLGHELRDWAEEKIKRFGATDGIDGENLLMEWNRYLDHGSDNSFYVWQWINSTLLSEEFSTPKE